MPQFMSYSKDGKLLAAGDSLASVVASAATATARDRAFEDAARECEIMAVGTTDDAHTALRNAAARIRSMIRKR